jgi:hypothetical protein
MPHPPLREKEASTAERKRGREEGRERDQGRYRERKREKERERKGEGRRPRAPESPSRAAGCRPYPRRWPRAGPGAWDSLFRLFHQARRRPASRWSTAAAARYPRRRGTRSRHRGRLSQSCEAASPNMMYIYIYRTVRSCSSCHVRNQAAHTSDPRASARTLRFCRRGRER